LPSLKKEAPEPIAEVNPATAGKYGISDGDMMSVETTKGKIVMKAHLMDEMAPMLSVYRTDGRKLMPTCLLRLMSVTDNRYTEMKALLCKIAKV
jgi:anaerobic selenocysteine-containing dehydrogenase